MGSLFLFLTPKKFEFKRRIRSSPGVGFDGIEGFIVRRSRSLSVDDPLRSSPFGSEFGSVLSHSRISFRHTHNIEIKLRVQVTQQTKCKISLNLNFENHHGGSGSKAELASGTGCGVASLCIVKNVLAMSFAQRDSHEAQVLDSRGSKQWDINAGEEG
ncbi:hypothetical protein OPV22_026764 [Ensete ventricosum]|uniref:Uncharacterized protein n=1 Tax=Ensete ventricosum TaxID=4639 RepID=A0AAV8PTP9_ENSVE|nr:hypothetical protein OPV22_026764 [Ensete ventricosum]